MSKVTLLLAFLVAPLLASAAAFGTGPSQNYDRKMNESVRERREAGVLRFVPRVLPLAFAKSNTYTTYENLRAFNTRMVDELCLAAFGKPLRTGECLSLRVASKELVFAVDLVLHSGTVIPLGEARVVAGYTFRGTAGLVPQKIRDLRVQLAARLVKWLGPSPRLHSDLQLSSTGLRGAEGFADFSYIEWPENFDELISAPSLAAQIRMGTEFAKVPRMIISADSQTRRDPLTAPLLADAQPVIASLSRKGGGVVRVEPVYGMADYGVAPLKTAPDIFGRVSKLATQEPDRLLKTLSAVLKPLSSAIALATKSPIDSNAYAAFVAEASQVSQTLRYVAVLNPAAGVSLVRHMVALKGAVEMLRAEPPTARDARWQSQVTKDLRFHQALDELAQEIDDGLFHILTDCERALGT